MRGDFADLFNGTMEEVRRDFEGVYGPKFIEALLRGEDTPGWECSCLPEAVCNWCWRSSALDLLVEGVELYREHHGEVETYPFRVTFDIELFYGQFDQVETPNQRSSRCAHRNHRRARALGLGRVRKLAS